MTAIRFFVLVVLFAFGLAATAFAAGDINRAAYNGDVAQVKALLAQGVNVDFRDRSGGTALHAAMFQKNMEIVELLLQHGYDINAQGSSAKASASPRMHSALKSISIRLGSGNGLPRNWMKLFRKPGR